MKHFSNSTLIRFLLIFACGWAITQLLVYFETVVVIFSISAVAAFLLSYPVNWLGRFIPRPLSIMIVFLISGLLLTSLGITIGITVISQGQQLSTSSQIYSPQPSPLSNNYKYLLMKEMYKLTLVSWSQKFGLNS
ncbi:MAG: AI-2E family transporter [Coleofasciculaceae cyanobacterium SM2_1_6]|nr:AI-2E family transporter [Coleofasciculaceae cyanobacterium SM2_1_6]